jgi:hypothetical protein
MPLDPSLSQRLVFIFVYEGLIEPLALLAEYPLWACGVLGVRERDVRKFE